MAAILRLLFHYSSLKSVYAIVTVGSSGQKKFYAATG